MGQVEVDGARILVHKQTTNREGQWLGSKQSRWWLKMLVLAGAFCLSAAGEE
jgi:hypothetical protein